jgi:uncharacterized membrane-anchored protein YitT (DUF2179 family)
MKKVWFILLGCLITSIGVITLKHSNIVTGGTAGLSLTITYLTNSPFATIFFLINLPFYIFSVLRMGWKFTLSTVGAITVLTIMTATDQLIPSFSIPMLLGSVVGGMFIGMGLSIIFMNGASLGGANILALFLQKRFNFNPGRVNFIFDLLVVLSSVYVVGLVRGLCSIVSIYVTSKVVSYFKNEIAVRNKVPTRKEMYVRKSPSVQVAVSE